MNACTIDFARVESLRFYKGIDCNMLYIPSKDPCILMYLFCLRLTATVWDKEFTSRISVSIVFLDSSFLIFEDKQNVFKCPVNVCNLKQKLLRHAYSQA